MGGRDDSDIGCALPLGKKFLNVLTFEKNESQHVVSTTWPNPCQSGYITDDDDDVGLHVLGCRVDILGHICHRHRS